MSARGRRPNVKACFQHPEQGGNVHPTILKQARKSGQLNLSNRGLTEVPETVWRINLDAVEESRSVSLENQDERWWEQTDLTKLILASNAITDLTDGIKLLPALTVLDVHDNQLISLPDAIGSLTNLQKLHAGHNGLQKLPESMGELTCLRSLHVEHNHIAELPESIGRLQELEELDVSYNKLAAIPLTIGCLSRLMRFNLANNEVKVLPHEMGLMTALRSIEATHNGIHSLPDEIGDLTHLEQLYLRHNKLTHLPFLQNCTNLKELHLGNNGLHGLTVENLECLQQLSVLDLRDNKIEKIPQEITLLQELERLDISNNAISNLPYVLGTLVKLKSIVLDGNPMKSIRRDIVMRGTNELKKYLRSRLDEQDETPKADTPAVRKSKGTSGVIGAGKEGIDAFTVNQTKSLEYSGKSSENIPKDLWAIAEQSNVSVINFSKNHLTEFPQEFAGISHCLTELHLGFNRMPTLDPVLGQLTKLLMLDIRNNQVSDLPDSITNLQNLRELVISFNRFNKLPKVIYELSSLEILLVSDNQIQTVDPDGLRGLSRLTSLNLQNNDIMQVPPELGLCTQLRALQLEGNPFRQPRSAILSKGTDALLGYLRDRIVS